MKVVLFCGGQGTRLWDYSKTIPKPMVTLGDRPILWHVMKYYAYYGHKDFILCLGHRADVIKNFFLNYEEAISNDFVISGGGREIRMLNTDIDEWTITFVDTGISSNIGERLLAVREHLADEEMFLANYSDGVGRLSGSLLRQLRIKSCIGELTSGLISRSGRGLDLGLTCIFSSSA